MRLAAVIPFMTDRGRYAARFRGVLAAASSPFRTQGGLMFRWGIIFLIIAVIAAALGFGSLAGTAAMAAKIVFVVGIILFLLSLFMGRRRP